MISGRFGLAAAITAGIWDKAEGYCSVLRRLFFLAGSSVHCFSRAECIALFL